MKVKQGLSYEDMSTGIVLNSNGFLPAWEKERMLELTGLLKFMSFVSTVL